MEWLAGLLALTFGAGTLGGVALDVLLKERILGQLQSTERLEVRVQSVPNYRIAQGDIDRIRVAGRGLILRPGLRVALAELETDPIRLDLSNLSNFSTPLRAAIRLQLTEADLNAALNTPEVLAPLKGVRAELPSFLGGVGQMETLDFTQPRLSLLKGQLELSALLAIVGKTPPGQEIRLTVRTGLTVTQGTRLGFKNTQFYLDEVAVPPDLAEIFAGSLNDVINLEALRAQGTTARILQLDLSPGQLELVGFAQVERLPG
ncbi:DUF2993 domain-containing protein [Candidatus Cyanaurora vandensis]|uniref:LmeA family phospholipid-binding protein n=1 Tax=Candidatus Cyanaurora vandensis TaxID=2714958 RepID=UPI00257F0A64|nr:DUF2993 domain-containing protein [Candidatus Cyanaurora vandensis]